jgi:hypothetical protein
MPLHVPFRVNLTLIQQPPQTPPAGAPFPEFSNARRSFSLFALVVRGRSFEQK